MTESAILPFQQLVSGGREQSVPDSRTSQAVLMAPDTGSNKVNQFCRFPDQPGGAHGPGHRQQQG